MKKFFSINNFTFVYFIFIFFINFSLHYTFNSNYFDLGIIFNQINSPLLVFENYPLRLINSFYHLIPFNLKEYSLILLNVIFFFLPFFLLKKKNNLILLIYLTSPLIILGALNSFHSDVLFISLSLLNLFFYKKNNKIFFISLFLIFIIKDIFFYFQIFYIYYVLEKKPNEFLNRLFISILIIFIFYKLNNISINIILYKLLFILFFIINYFYIFNSLRLLGFFLCVFSTILIYDPPIQFYSLKGHNTYYLFPFILFSLFKFFSRHNFFLYFTIIINILCNIYIFFTDYRFKEILLSLKNLNDIKVQKILISKINNKDNIIFTQNNVNFFPNTKNYYPLKEENIYKELIAKNTSKNVYFIIDVNKIFFIDDKKCSLEKNLCYSFLQNVYNEVSPKEYLSNISKKSILVSSYKGFMIYKLEK
jgi:hypothetical protein